MAAKRLGDALIIPIGVGGVALAVIIAWSLASGPFNYFVPSPFQAVEKLYGGFAIGWIIPHALSTVRVIISAFLIAFAVGFGAGLFIGLNRFWREVLEPMVVSVYVLPKIVLFPLFLLIFGLGVRSLVALAAVSALFPILLNVSTGVREMNPIYEKVGKAFNTGRLKMILKIYAPAIALPLITGMRVAFSLSFIATVIGEMVASDQGLGQELFRSYAVLDIPKMYGIMLLLFASAFVVNMVPWFIERRLRGQIG